MLLIAPGDAIASPRSRRSEQRSASADLAATARSGQLANAAQPLPAPTPTFEDSRAGRWLFAVLVLVSLAVVAYQFGWLA